MSEHGEDFVTVRVNADEVYPFFGIVGNLFGRPVTLREHELRWIESTMKDFWEVQDFLRDKYDEKGGSND